MADSMSETQVSISQIIEDSASIIPPWENVGRPENPELLKMQFQPCEGQRWDMNGTLSASCESLGKWRGFFEFCGFH